MLSVFGGVLIVIGYLFAEIMKPHVYEELVEYKNLILKIRKLFQFLLTFANIPYTFSYLTLWVFEGDKKLLTILSLFFHLILNTLFQNEILFALCLAHTILLSWTNLS